MIKTCPFTMIAVCLLLFTGAIQAQTPQPKLNQIELMKLQIGTFKCDDNKDTTVFWKGKYRFRQFGLSLRINTRTRPGQV